MNIKPVTQSIMDAGLLAAAIIGGLIVFAYVVMYTMLCFSPRQGGSPASYVGAGAGVSV